MAEDQSSLATRPLFTKEQIENARRAGIDDREIGLYFAEGSPEIQNALESGVTIDELAEYFAIEPVAKPEQPKLEEEKTVLGKAGQIAKNVGEGLVNVSDFIFSPEGAKMAAGLTADVAISEGGKAASTLLGAQIGALPIASGVGAPVAAVTIPLGAGIGYVAGALGFGAAGDYAAQKIEGKEDVDLIRMGTSSLLNLIPGTEIKAGPRVLREASKALAKRPIATTAATGALARPLGMAGEEVFTDADYSLTDYLKGAGSGAALGGGLGVASKRVGRIFAKYRDKTPEELAQLANQGDKSAVENINILTAGLTPDEIAANNERVYESIGAYIRGAVASAAPSRVIGPEATRIAKYSKYGIEAANTQATTIGKRIDAFLAKNNDPVLKQEAADLLSGGKPQTNLLPDNIKNDIIEGRRLIRDEQQMKLDLHNSGKVTLPDGKAEMIEASLNRGDYDTTHYRFFNESGYKPSKEDAQALKQRLMTGLTDEQKAARLDAFIRDFKPPRHEIEAVRRFHGIAPGAPGKSNAAYQRDLKALYTPSNERAAKFKKKLDEEKYTEAQANEYISNLNLKMKDTENLGGVASFVTGSGTPQFLREKKVLSPELEKYLGRVNEVGERIAGTVSVLSRDSELRKADAEITQALMDMGALVKSDSPNWTPDLRPIKLRKGDSKIGKEALFGTAETQAALNKIYGANLDETSRTFVARTAKDVYDAFLTLKKGSLVLGNLASYFVQVPGNAVLTTAAGMNPILGAGGAFKLALGGLRGSKLGDLPLIRNVANQASPSSLREFRNLQKRGLISNAVPFADIQATLSGKRFSRVVSKVLDPLGKAYSIFDNTFRLINYNNWKLELKRLMPTASDELIEEGAIRATTRTYPNYDSLSEGVKTASRLGVGLGPFSSYGLELARTQYQQAKVIKELADGTFVKSLGKEFEGIPVNSGAAKKLGAKRAAAMATAYVGAAALMNEVNRNSVSEEKEQALRETVFPEYAERKPLFIKSNDDGSFNYVNASYYAPQTTLMAPVKAAMSGKTQEEALANFVKTIQEDYGGMGTFAGEAYNKLIYGRDPKTGKLISSSPTFFGQTGDRLKAVASDTRPATIKALEKDQPFSEKMLRLGGIRIERQTIPEGFGFRARAINESIGEVQSNASSIAYKLKNNKITPQEYAADLQNENANYRTYIERMQRHIGNLRTLGQDDASIIQMLRDAKFSNLQSLDIMQGKFTPLDPTAVEKTSEQYAKIRGKDRNETMRNIYEVEKTDQLLAKKFRAILKEEEVAAQLNLSPIEKLIAALPTDEKVNRLLPEIKASQNPEAYAYRLAERKILSSQDKLAIDMRLRSNE